MVGVSYQLVRAYVAPCKPEVRAENLSEVTWRVHSPLNMSEGGVRRVSRISHA